MRMPWNRQMVYRADRRRPFRQASRSSALDEPGERPGSPDPRKNAPVPLRGPMAGNQKGFPGPAELPLGSFRSPLRPQSPCGPRTLERARWPTVPQPLSAAICWPHKLTGSWCDCRAVTALSTMNRCMAHGSSRVHRLSDVRAGISAALHNCPPP